MPPRKQKKRYRDQDTRIIMDNAGSPGFTVSHDIALRTDLSIKAKGLYLVMCSLFDRKKEVLRSDILRHIQEGPTAYETAMAELRDNGFVYRHFNRDSQGRILSSNLIFYKHSYKVATESPIPQDSVIPHPTPQSKNQRPQNEPELGEYHDQMHRVRGLQIVDHLHPNPFKK